MIPSMSGREIGAELRLWASQAESGTAIVELGVWLGAGTENLGLGAMDSNKNVEIHCFDRFIANDSEVKRALLDGVILKKNQDTLPVAKKNLSRFGISIVYHKRNILSARWKNKPISLYIDDVCKRTDKFQHAIKTFSPYWIPGKTIVVLMDYYWHLRHPKEKDAQCQPEFMKKYSHCFQHIKNWQGLCCAAFLYLGGLKH